MVVEQEMRSVGLDGQHIIVELEVEAALQAVELVDVEGRGAAREQLQGQEQKQSHPVPGLTEVGGVLGAVGSGD